MSSDPSADREPGPTRAARAWRGFSAAVLGTRRRIGGTVYGTILVLSVIAAGGRTAEDRPGELAIVILTTSVVFWISHAYSQGLEESARTGRRLHRGDIRAVARGESALVLAAAAPAGALLLGAVGLVRDPTAVWLALGVGVAVLVVQGVRYARLERLGPTGTALAIGVNLVLGLAIVVLKAAVYH